MRPFYVPWGKIYIMRRETQGQVGISKSSGRERVSICLKETSSMGVTVTDGVKEVPVCDTRVGSLLL
jgi:hypothetical protein